MTRDIDDLSDADLIVRSREGDSRAYGVLFKRHWHAARGMAASVTNRFDADDLASEAFARILQAVEKGNGPRSGFRSYLAATVRNVAIDWSRRKVTPNIEDPDVIEDWTYSELTALDRVDRQTVAKAFYALPTSWQEVLWYTEVEDMAPREVAPLLGLNSNAVSALALRAREGLRQAWINAHLAETGGDDPIHGWTLKRLGTHVRGRLSKADARRLTEHLQACDNCSAAAEEASQVGSRLALGILPLFLGLAGAAAYTSWSSGSGSAVAATLAGSGMSARQVGRLRDLFGSGTGGANLGIASVAASVVAAAALTSGVFLASPQPATMGALSAGSPAIGPSGETRRPVPPADQKATSPGTLPGQPEPEQAEHPAEADASPAAARPGEEPGAEPRPPDVVVLPPPLPPVDPVAPPQGCEAGIRLVPAPDRLLAYALDDAPGSDTATDLVQGSTARYSGTPGDAQWALIDDAVRPPSDQFSIQIWFKTPVGGGRLMGFSNSGGAGPSSEYDRHLFLTDDGRVVFGVFPGALHTIASGRSYADDAWHQATATLSSAGMALYIDGRPVAQDAGVTSAHRFSGHWRIGSDNLDNWGPETPANRQTAGTLSYAAVYGVALTSDQIEAQWKRCASDGSAS